MHSPKGANASFTIGMEDNGGGFSVEKDYIPDQDVFIGYKDGKDIFCLPFYSSQKANASEKFVKKDNSNKQQFDANDSNDTNTNKKNDESKKTILSHKNYNRELQFATDKYTLGKMDYSIYTPVDGVPDPEICDNTIMKREVTPSVISVMSIDNRNGKLPLQCFFGVSPIKGKILLSEMTNDKLIGIYSLEGYGFAASSESTTVKEFGEFNILDFFNRKEIVSFQLAPIGGIYFWVPAGEIVTVDIALGFYKGEIVTGGVGQCKYFYTRYFKNIVEVLEYTLANKSYLINRAIEVDRKFSLCKINDDRKFIVSQSIRSYYASTMLFLENNKPRWVVNEGSYMMMNTFDLFVDHLYYELDNHPWLVLNTLKSFANKYSYEDTVHYYDEPEVSYPGGISFTHDQGVFNVFSREGYSTYEIKGQDGCFSYMTQEQLCNFVLCSALYVKKTGNKQWQRENQKLFSNCLTSMINRDHPLPEMRDGVMDLDSDRCGNQSEITTYDSLDHSLGQSRRNLYLAVKCWATYISLEYLLQNHDTKNAKIALNQAKLSASTISKAYNKDLGYIPAILDGKDKSAIIPAIEGLIYPYMLDLPLYLDENGVFGNLVTCLKKHMITILDKHLCLFDDGGWKLSANSVNSWVSKIFLCQYISKEILAIKKGNTSVNDMAHALWWKKGCPTNPGIDQIFAGNQELRNFHYPRAITSYLWIYEGLK